jgi:GH15 family glucan-1,4-alpha-glucosidase
MTHEPGDEASRGGQPPIGDYAVIGDCRTMALVSKEGAIDWLCLPRFDGGSVFAALLDEERGGRFAVRPVGAFSSSRRYLTDTNVLETTFRTPHGVVRLTDLMPVHDPRRDGGRLQPDHEVLRRIECLEGEVEVEVMCDPRFDYGRRVPRSKEMGKLGIHFDGGADDLMLVADITLAPTGSGSGWRGAATLHGGEKRHVSLTSAWAEPTVVGELGEAADRRIDATAKWWRSWLQHCSYEGTYRDEVSRSMLTLKLLTYPASGAILAAGTTSLPEAVGAGSNWDYRYCWLRDASMTMEVLLHLGFAPEGEAFLGWLLHATRLTFPKLQVLYDVYGRTDRRESDLEHLAGYRGSRPVRVGNAASDQLQLDVYGEVIDAAWTFVDQGGSLDSAEARLIAGLGETVLRSWRQPDNGMWEVRGPRRHFTQSKAMCWVALDRLLRLQERGVLTLSRSRAVIEREMRAIRDAIESHGWNDRLGSYVAWFGGEDVDAALLLLGIEGYEDPGSERMRGTMRCVRDRLEIDGLLYRYGYDDHLPGREGAFGICEFWEAELLARQGRIDEAVRSFEHAADFANDVGLFSEEIDPESGELLGNLPQAFTHLGLVSAANQIARSRGRPPEHKARTPRTTEAETEDRPRETAVVPDGAAQP